MWPQLRHWLRSGSSTVTGPSLVCTRGRTATHFGQGISCWPSRLIGMNRDFGHGEERSTIGAFNFIARIYRSLSQALPADAKGTAAARADGIRPLNLSEKRGFSHLRASLSLWPTRLVSA